MTIDTNSLPFVEKLLGPRRADATPWLIWHSADGERIELSGRVFDNWVAKTANLLAELFDVQEASELVFDLPVHWKSLVLAVAAWHHGAAVITPDDPQSATATLWISDRPAGEHIPASADVLGVDLAALALSFTGDLGPAEDYNAEVRAFADDYYPQPVDGGLSALRTANAELSYEQLFSHPGRAQGTILVSSELGMERLLPFAIGQWQAGDALVLVGPGVEITPRLLEGERVTARHPEH